MKKISQHIKSALMLILLLSATAAMAQGPGGGFPGGGHPGGRPGGGYPGGGHPGGRPGGWDQAQQAQQVRQKKKVREGDTFKVVGSVRDSVNGDAIIYMNVAVLDASDSAFVKGTSTDAEGRFELTGITAGDYILRATYIGYQKRMIPFHVDNNTALGVIKLKPGAVLMKEVTISADRPLYAMDGEKMIYNVSEDPSIQTGTTTDALQNAPGVEVDIEGNITLRGVSSVEIWVNDKPSKLTAENLKTYLETLPANALARIETITNPSAKYATEAEAVINIVTSAHIKKNHFISFGGHANQQPSINPWVSYMWANERLSVNLYGSFRYSKRENSANSTAVTRADNAAHDGYDTIQADTSASSSWSKSYGGNLSLNIDYQVDSMTDLSVWANGNYNGSDNWSGAEAIRNQILVSKYYAYGDTTDRDQSSFFGMLGADLVHKFDNRGHNLRLGINSNISKGWTDQYYNRDYTIYDDLDQNKYNKTYSNDWSVGANARYNRPFSKDFDFSIGGRVDHSAMNNIYNKLLDTDHDGTYETVDDLRQYEFLGSDDKLNADLNLTRRWGGFTAELGMGGGLVHTQFQYTNMYFPDDSAFTYITWNPSLHLSYRTKSMHNFKLNYSLRQRTPGEEQLTSFRTYGEDSYSVGNPDLKPYTTHSAEVGWTKFFQRFGSVGLEGYARYSANEISKLTDVEDDPYIGRIISYSTPYNMGYSYRYGASANVTYRPTGFFNLRLYANLYDYGYHMEYATPTRSMLIDTSALSYSLRLNMWAKVWDKYQVHCAMGYSSPTIGLLSTSKQRYWLNMGVRSDFFKRKLSVFVNINDLFNWGKRVGGGSTTTNPYYLSNSSTYTINSRSISAGLTLRFGKMELERNAKAGSESDSVIE